MEPDFRVNVHVIAEQLGGAGTIGTDIDSTLAPIRAIERGVRIEAADHLAARFGVGAAELCAMLRISRGTLRARRRRGRLNAIESERLWRAARVLAYAAEVFGSPERAGLWIVCDPPVLMGYRPVDLLAWEAGAQAVRDVLGRLEHGTAA